MKLDATDLRYITGDEFRVLTAVEMGSKNHEVVPNTLIAKIAGLRNGGVNKILGSLAKRSLVAKVQNSKYDGYRLTYGGYDFLAMRALSKRDSIYSVGNQIGVGKESDIYVVADVDGNQMVLKLHRLGRQSFRAIKEKRDYMGNRKSASWMYMSRLAAQKEWAFMKVLRDHGYPVPKPIDQARHCIVMEYIDAFPLRQIADIPSPGRLYSQLLDLIVRLAHAGLIHGDFNEFNILIHRVTGEPVVIDFPQMVSTSHENAEWYFNRDVDCIRRFFRRRFRYESVLYPHFSKTMREGEEKEDSFRLDVVVAASGFSKRDMTTLEEYMKDTEAGDDEGDVDLESSDGEQDDDVECMDVDRLSSTLALDEGEASGSTPTKKRTGFQSHEEDEDGVPDSNSDTDSDTGSSTSIDTESQSETHSHRSRRSLAPSPTESLAEHATNLSLASDAIDSQLTNDIDSPSPSHSNVPVKSQTQLDTLKERAAADVGRQQVRQSKFHSKRSARKIGRPKGSKAKQDNRIRLEKGGFWE